MSKYPGPEYLVTGEYGECEHGTPDNYPCAFCLQAKLTKADEDFDKRCAALERARTDRDAMAHWRVW